MQPQDLFVGSIAALGGCFFLFSAGLNQDWCFRFWAARMVESKWGRPQARLLYVGMGIGLIALGMAIASGWRWQLIPDADAGSSANGQKSDTDLPTYASAPCLA